MEGTSNAEGAQNSQQNNMLMVKDLRQNTAHHRGLFAHPRHPLDQEAARPQRQAANCLLREKNTELKDKLLAAETQAA